MRRQRFPLRIGLLVRVACALVAVAALFWIGLQVGDGVARVRRGEITMAEWWQEMGAKWRGEMPTPGGDAPPSSDGAAEDAPSPPAEDGQTPSPMMPSEQKSLYEYDWSVLPAASRAIVPVDICAGERAVLAAGENWHAPTAGVGAQEPLVLIVHSHSSEGYSAPDVSYVAADENVGRASGDEASVIAVGQTLAQALEALGVQVIHVTEHFDEQGNAGAFARAAACVQERLVQYPSVRYVIDLHRASGIDEKGNVLRAVAWNEDKVTAQMGIATSEDDASYALACALANALNGGQAPLCKAPEQMDLGAEWEAQHIYALRIEIGTAGNSVVEAKAAARVLAQGLAAICQ